MTENPLLVAALDYAARGWPVFPAHPKTKEALPERDRDGEGKYIPKTGGIRKATTDEATIRAWWKRWPKAIIVAAVGPEAGVFALDFDPRDDDVTGESWTVPELIARTEARIGVALPVTATARSPSGGEHWYYRWPAEGPPITGRDALKVQHVDVRGAGGGCNLPPSVRADGETYVWLRGLEQLVDAPAELLAVLQKPPPEPLVPRQRRGGVGFGGGPIDEAIVEAVRKYALAGVDRECRLVETAGSGARNPQLNRSAFAVAGLVAATLSNGASVLSGPMAKAALFDAAKANPGRDDLSQIEATLDSGWTSGLANPRDLSKQEDEARARLGRQSHRSPGAQRGSAGHAGAQQPRAAPAADAAANAATAPPPDDSSSSPAATPPGPGEDGKKKSSQMGGSRLPPAERGAGECDDAGILLPQTDLGNAERWLLRHGHAFRWCPALGWLAWDGRRWSRDDADRQLSESVYATVRAIQDEAAACRAAGIAWRAGEWPRWIAERAAAQLRAGKLPLPEAETRFRVDDLFDAMLDDEIAAENPDPWVKRPKTGDWKRRSDLHAAFGRVSENRGRIDAIRGGASSEGLIRAAVTFPIDSFDADPMRFNVANGTLVFRRSWGHDCWVGEVQLVPHDPADLITMLADVVYDPQAESPVYDTFLARVQPDAAVRQFLHAYAGYSLTGDTREQALVINHGSQGGNGKSTWINAVAQVIGDYSVSVPIEVFLDAKVKSGSAPSPELARLLRRRLVRTAEPPRDAEFAEALLKSLSGEDTITARGLYAAFFEFTPEFKMVVTMNPAPKLSSDAAIWRRVNIVPWVVSMTNSPDRDPELPAKLKLETSGILNRLVAGLIDWLQDGLPKVDAIVAATTAQRERSDPLGRFLAEVTTLGPMMVLDPDPKVRVGARALHQLFLAWGEWAGTSGGKPWSEKGFVAAMVDKGFETFKSSNAWYLGFRPTRSVGDFINPDTGKPWTSLGGDDAGPARFAGVPDPPAWEDRRED